MAKPFNLAGIDLNLLKVLDVLLAERSVTRAGERLGRSQPAVSNALARLRQLLDDDLLVRAPEGMALTPRAEAIRRPLQDAMALMETCLAEGRSFESALATGVFRIAMPDRLSLPLLPPLHELLRESAPYMSIHVTTADRTQGLELLEDERVDVALGFIVDPPRHVRTEQLFEEHLYCVFRHDHPLLHGRSFDLPALLSFPHLVVSAGGRTAIFDGMLADRGLERHALVAISNFTTVPNLLVRSDMVGVFTERAARAFAAMPGLAIRRVPDGLPKVQTLMVWHMRTDKDPRGLWLRQRIRDACRPAEAGQRA